MKDFFDLHRYLHLVWIAVFSKLTRRIHVTIEKDFHVSFVVRKVHSLNGGGLNEENELWEQGRELGENQYYRPQRSCGKVMFLHLSVILSTRGCIRACIGADTPRADTPQADPPGQTPPVDRHSLGRHPYPPADGYCGGRYASCWNAFLF